VASAEAGGQVTCDCGQRLAVPTLRGLRALQPAPDDAPRQAPLGWSGMHGALFAGGLFLALVGLVLCAVHLWRYAQIGGLAVDHSDEWIAAELDAIDKLTPEQALAEWSADVANGLGEAQAPWWVTAKARVGEYWWRIKAGLVLTATGIALSLATLLVGRRPRGAAAVGRSSRL
jgi:hypothetical protein